MSALIPTDETALRRLVRHYSDSVRLALPVIVSRAGMVLMGAVDAVILGRLDSVQLAHYGLGHAVSNMLFGTLIGLLLGASALTAHALGAGEDRVCGAIFRQAVPYALVLGFGAALFCLSGPFLLPLLGQSPEMTAGSAPVLAVLGLGFPGVALHLAAASFLEGLKRPLPALVVMIGGNVLNAVLCWIFSRGALGVPLWGAEGSAWATTSVRWAMGVSMFAVVWWMSDRARWGVRDGFRHAFRDGRDLRRFGYAAGASMAIESGAFSGLGFMAGMLSAGAMAAYTIFLNLIALPFMAAAGTATATAVRVGVGYGAEDRREMNWAGWCGLSLAILFLSPVVGLYAVAPEAVAGMYTIDAALIAELSPIVLFSVWILLVDGAQVVMANALRGRNDRWIPTALHFFSYFGVMLPVSAFLAFTLERGIRGIAEGILAASVISAGVLIARFAWIGRAARVEPARVG